MSILSKKQTLSTHMTLSSLSVPEFRKGNKGAILEDADCPHAPVLKPRNTCFKFNSTKWFIPRENIVKYTPFFFSEGEESSDDDFSDSTMDMPTVGEGKIRQGY